MKFTPCDEGFRGRDIAQIITEGLGAILLPRTAMPRNHFEELGGVDQRVQSAYSLFKRTWRVDENPGE